MPKTNTSAEADPTLDISLPRKRSAANELADRVREKILSGEMPPGLRLPTTQQLAQQWGTYVPAVHAALSQLTKEGLLDRRHRKGTFVREPEEKLTRIGIFASNQLWQDHGDLLFSRELFLTLEKHLIEQNIRTTVWFENRRGKKSGTPLPALKKSVEQNEVQAIISLNAGLYNTDWLNKLAVPVSGINTGLKHHVSFSVDSFYEIALGALKAEGCRTVAHICAITEESPEYSRHLEAFHNALKKLDMKTDPSWKPVPFEYPRHHDEYGFESFSALWKKTKKPEGLIVYPDTAAKGVMLGLSTLGVQIPQALSVVFHKNAEIPFLCPLPVNMVENSCQECARALVDQLKHVCQGEATETSVLKYALRKSE